MENPAFAKFVKLMKMKVLLLRILNQTRATGVVNEDDILQSAVEDALVLDIRRAITIEYFMFIFKYLKSFYSF